MKYGSLTIKKVELNEYYNVASIEFGEDSTAEQVAEFLSDYGIGSEFAKNKTAAKEVEYNKDVEHLQEIKKRYTS